MNATTITFGQHEPGCPKMTAAGDPQCTCGIRAAFEAWGGPGVDKALYGAFAAGWMASRTPKMSSFTVASGYVSYAPTLVATGGIPIPGESLPK